MVLTRASSSGALDQELGTQLLKGRNTLWIACGVLIALALVPGLPKLAFVLMAAGVALIARKLPATQTETTGAEGENAAAGKAKNPETVAGENLASLLKIDELTLEIGFQLIPLVDEKQGGQMLNRVRALRRHLATELGFIVPSVHITDNLRLKPREYVVSLRGVEIARWQTEQNCLLAVNADPKARPLPGVETREPAFGVNARWIQPGLEEQALAAGYSVVDQTTVIGTHLGELIRRHAHELLGRQEVKRLLDSMNDSHPKLVEELVPKLLSLGEVQRVLQQLLREQVSIRDLGTILEALVEAAQQSKNLVHMVEAVRQALGRGLVHSLLDSDGGLKVLTLDQRIENELVGTFDPQAANLLLGDGARSGGMPADFLRRLVDSVKRLTGASSGSALPVLLCPSPARYHVRRWLEPFLPKVTVLSPVEIPPEIRVKSIGTIG
jgi:flagellar biosynthesis protein FlhA